MPTKIEDEWVERLAVSIAWQDVGDHVCGEHWYGWPDPDDPDQMQESYESRLPYARKTARAYLETALGIKGD